MERNRSLYVLCFNRLILTVLTRFIHRNNILFMEQKMKKTTDLFISKMLVVSYLQAVPICTQYPLVYFVNFWRQLPCLPFKNTSSLSEGGRHQFRSTKDGMHSTAHPTQPPIWVPKQYESSHFCFGDFRFLRQNSFSYI